MGYRSGEAARVAAALAVMWGMCSAHADALDEINRAQFDWTSFSAQVDGVTARYVAGSQWTYAYVYGETTTSASKNDWTTLVNAAQSFSDTEPIGANGFGSSSSLLADVANYTSTVNANRYAEVALNAGQTLQVSVNYYMINGAGTGSAEVELQLLGADINGDFTNLVENETNALSTFAAFPSPVAGTLTFSFTSPDAESYRLAVNANAELTVSSVPEPSSWLLLLAGAGLLVPAAAARRRAVR